MKTNEDLKKVIQSKNFKEFNERYKELKIWIAKEGVYEIAFATKVNLFKIKCSLFIKSIRGVK